MSKILLFFITTLTALACMTAMNVAVAQQSFAFQTPTQNSTQNSTQDSTQRPTQRLAQNSPQTPNLFGATPKGGEPKMLNKPALASPPLSASDFQSKVKAGSSNTKETIDQLLLKNPPAPPTRMPGAAPQASPMGGQPQTPATPSIPGSTAIPATIPAPAPAQVYTGFQPSSTPSSAPPANTTPQQPKNWNIKY